MQPEMEIGPFRSNRTLHAILLGYAALWIAMAIHPVDRFNWMLENTLVAAAVIGVAATYRLFAFSNTSYLLIALFTALHTVGAHYTYEMTPVDRLLSHLLGFQRNNYDRLVHFSFGLLLAYPILEVLQRLTGLARRWALILAPLLIVSLGAIYELMEMAAAFLFAPDVGALFLGSQGDPWDAQHDIEAALYGSVLTAAGLAAADRIRSSHSPAPK